MVDIDSFYEMLNEVCEELPDGMFEGLHLGVILEEAEKISPHARNNDLVIMGEYHRGTYGNRITIYYGSFVKSYGWADRAYIKDRLREVVRHEFRHHLENLSGMYGADSLEHEDKVELKKYLDRE